VPAKGFAGDLADGLTAGKRQTAEMIKTASGIRADLLIDFFIVKYLSSNCLGRLRRDCKKG
jgi:hypothetical protein